MNPQPLLVLLPYHRGDLDQARQLLNWIGELSPRLAPHCCLLAADSIVPHETKIELGNIAKGIFHFAETAVINVPLDATGWPKASNAMFRVAGEHVRECFKLPFLWLEPDCIPLRPSWLDELSVAYTSCPKRFMGPIIASNQPGLPPFHMPGCAVYPNNALNDMAQFTKTDAPWDIADAPYVIPRMFPTPLIQHVWGEKDLPPVFKATKEPGDPVNTCELSFIKPEACLFHRTKTGGLIELLRNRKRPEPIELPGIVIDSPEESGNSASPATEQMPAIEAPVKRGPGRPRKQEQPVTA